MPPIRIAATIRAILLPVCSLFALASCTETTNTTLTAGISPIASTIAVDMTTNVVADGGTTVTITVVVRDALYRPVAGQTVLLAAGGGGNTLVQPAATTNAFGVAVGTLTSIQAETKAISAMVNPGPSQLALDVAATVQFIGDAANLDPALSTVVGSPLANVVADGVVESTITVTVQDVNGNVVPGQTVTLASTGTLNTLTQPAAMTDSNGVATGTLATTRAELKTITATVNPGPGQVVPTQMPMIQFIGDFTNIGAADTTVVSSPPDGVLADGVATTTITVTVKDVNDNAVPGQTVQVAATGLANTMTGPAAVTDANGMATATLASTQAEPKVVTATINPGPGQVVPTQMPSVEFVWALANTYYVRTGGDDLADGASPATAWATIGQAAATLAAGDTVYVGAGTYAEQVMITADGSPGSPIRFVADVLGTYTGDAGAVVVDGGGANETIHLDGSDHVIVDGFTVTGAMAGGGIHVGDTASTNVTIRDNVIHGNDKGIYVRDSDSISIEHNRISNNLGVEGDGITIRSSDSGAVRNNLVYDNARYGVQVLDASLNVLVSENTLYQNMGSQVLVDGTGNSVTATDNVIAFGGANGVELLVGTSTATSDYNDSFGNAGVDWSGLAMGANDISMDPLLVDPDGADNLLGGANGADDELHLTSPGSPAIDAGSVAATAAVLADGTPLADRTTRTDGLLDGTGADGSTLNLGFHYPAQASAMVALVQDDARLTFGEGDARQARERTWDDSGSAWSVEASSAPAAANVLWTVNRAGPTASGEELLAVLADTGTGSELDLLRWNGGEWIVDWTATGITSANADKRGFDLEYEASSGDAVVVYSNDTDTPVYRTRSQGEWSAEQVLPLNDGMGPNPDPNTGTVLWVELAARPGTDEMALGYADGNADLVVIVWDGTQWTTATATALETGLKTNPITSVVHNRPFDAAYESLTGNLMVAWTRGATVGFWWSKKDAGMSTWSAAAQVSAAPSSGVPHFVDLAPEPGGNRIAGGFFDMGDGTERLGLATWTGSAWANPGEYDSQTWNVNDSATGDFHGGVGWVGTSGVAVCVYPDNQTGTLDWARWSAGGGWSIQGDVAMAGKGFTESVAIRSFYGKDELMAVFSDTNADLYAATYDGGTWTITEAGSALETDLSSIDSRPFSLIIRP